jgi:hypothetical protein
MLYDNSIRDRIENNRLSDQNTKLKAEIELLVRKLKKKDQLLEDSLACTFVACPCAEGHKSANVQILFKLRKKVMELRDLVAI